MDFNKINEILETDSESIQSLEYAFKCALEFSTSFIIRMIFHLFQPRRTTDKGFGEV